MTKFNEDVNTTTNNLSAGQCVEVKIEYVDITLEKFTAKLRGFEDNLTQFFAKNKALKKET